MFYRNNIDIVSFVLKKSICTAYFHFYLIKFSFVFNKFIFVFDKFYQY